MVDLVLCLCLSGVPVSGFKQKLDRSEEEK